MTSKPVRGVFVTGTDTGVGKTVVSAALVHRLRAFGSPVRYWKPIQTGIEDDDDTATVRWLIGGNSDAVLDCGVRLPRPLSPHLAARLAGVAIDIDDVLHAAGADLIEGQWVVEGAGGVLVPLNERELMVDLMTRLALPVVVVARTTLGTINHTLLTLEALRARALEITGVVMVGAANADNRDAIERYGGVQVLGALPLLPTLSPQALQEAAAALGDLEALRAKAMRQDLPA